MVTRGLCRILDMLMTQIFPDRYRSEHGDLPPRIASLIHAM